MLLDLEYLTKKVKEIASEAGSFLLMERENFDRSKVEEKNSHDYVSYVDKESERFIVERLSSLLPEAGFITEEGTAILEDNEYMWVVDPLDGTTNFIHNNPPFCVSIALRTKEEIIIGVVYEVCRDECYYTYKGAPSYLNGKIIHVSDINDMDKAFVELGLPYDYNSYKPTANMLVNALYGNVGGIRVQGSTAAELCYVACGRFEARIEAFLGPWDVAAGAIILMNAGGKITDFTGGDDWISGRTVLATNKLLHEALINIINEEIGRAHV